jgi:predicted phage baseplate assembly protein
MPLLPPALDDRSFDDLVEEVLSRIPAHTPEWTNPRPGDPGRTLIELFAWLTDTLLYRANLIPERQRLAFLRLLGIKMRPAIAARGIVNVTNDDQEATAALYLKPLATLKGTVNFETRSELTVLPVIAEAYSKRPLTREESAELADVISGLQQVYGLSGRPVPYVTTPVFAGGAAEQGGFDLIERTVDKCLWLALLVPNKKPTSELIKNVKKSLVENPNGGQQTISLGVAPAIEVPALLEEIGSRAPIPHAWEITSVDEKNEVEYHPLTLIEDSTAGLTRRGVMRFTLPAPKNLGAPANDVRLSLGAGVGDQPPRIDVPETAARLVAWIRLRPTVEMRSLSLSWVGINAVEIDQRQTLRGRVVGQSDGSADQQMQMPGQSIEPETLELQVEEPGLGYRAWQQVDDLALVGRDAAAFTLDSEAGTVQFGNGVNGRIPEQSRRVRVALMRAGGGRAGNLPAGALTEISARDLIDNIVAKLKVSQPLATEGGQDSETLEEAERRIPALFRHRDRAVTEDDYRQLAADTPGIRMGRVEVLRLFKPQQRRTGVPGVISVMALPFKEGFGLPNPRPDRPFLESVHSYLDARRPLTTELYVIGCEYVELGISVAVTLRDGFSGQTVGAAQRNATSGREGVLSAVREVLRRYLWPLAPGGVDGRGWQLGRTVRDRELEVIVAQVAGVSAVSGINLFQRQGDQWQRVPRPNACAPVEMRLEPWQLPELLSVVAVTGDAPPGDLLQVLNPFAAQSAFAVPVVPEVC